MSYKKIHEATYLAERFKELTTLNTFFSNIYEAGMDTYFYSMQLENPSLKEESVTELDMWNDYTRSFDLVL